MRPGARARRRADSNQPDLVKYIRRKGASFQHTHSLPGALDGIIGYLGIDQRIEIKDPEKPTAKQKLTEAEQEVFDNWRGRPPVVVLNESDIDDVLWQIRNNVIHN